MTEEQRLCDKQMSDDGWHWHRRAEVKVNCHIIGPFNAWWPSYGGHCEAEPKVIAAFDAGFRAGVLEARRRITRNGSLVGAATNDWFDGVAENGSL